MKPHAPFSVVVPLFNKAAFVGKAVRSVLEQTHGDFECVVVDDGSTDGSADVVRGINDERIHLVSQRNQGVSAARNAGIGVAQHELIAFLDADDWWDPEYLAEMARLADRYRDLALFSVPFAAVKGGVVGQAQRWDLGCEDAAAIDLLQACLERKTFLMPMFPSSVVIRRRVLELSGLFDSAIGYYEDYDLFLRIALHTRCAMLGGRALAFYNKDVPVSQRATGRLPPVHRHLVSHLDKLSALKPGYAPLDEYIERFRVFNLMMYVEEGASVDALRPLTARIDARRLTSLQRLYFTDSMIARVLVQLNVLRRGILRLRRSAW
jgi:glycosyltransferase involved in cell wall biosynthesis